MSGRVFDFERAIVRIPAPSVAKGLRTGAEAPVYEKVFAEHGAYVAALEAAGLAVEILPALPDFPDAVFVEDPAFVVPEGAILLRPGAPTRAGEVAELELALHRSFDRVERIPHGVVDGGDILILPDEILVGLSARTGRKGANAFVALMRGWSRSARIVMTPPGVLHLKTACALLDEQTVVATPRLAAAGIFKGMDVLVTPRGEKAAANLLRVKDTVLLADGFPRLAERISARGYALARLPTEHIARIDAGLSCMSLRW